jgi:hypothetical protein
MNRLGGGSDPVSLQAVKELNREKAQYERSLKYVDGHRLETVLTYQERLESMAAQSTLSAEASPGGVAPAPQGGPALGGDAPALKIARGSLDGETQGRSREKNRAKLRKAVGDGTPEPRELSGIEKLNAIYRKEREQRPTRREDDFEPAYLRRPS